MNKLLSSFARLALALVALALVAPSIIDLLHALLPLVLLAAGLAVLLRIVWAVTRRW
jgi:hypothetical protein